MKERRKEKERKRTLLLAVISLVVLSGCGKIGEGQGGIRFSATSPATRTQSSQTKTAYSGKDGSNGSALTGSSTSERLDWVNGDLIRVYSAQAAQAYDASRHEADYVVTGHSESESSDASTATISPSDGRNGLQWGAGEHTFYAMYPSPATTGLSGASFTEGTMRGMISSSQRVTRRGSGTAYDADMKYAYMLAKSEAVPSGASSVSLPFKPQYTAYEFAINSGENESVSLSSFTLSCTSGYLAGTMTIPATGYSNASSISFGGDKTQEITINFVESLGSKLTVTPSGVTFTVLALPCTVSGLKITFTGDEIGSRTLSLQTAASGDITFEAFKKYRISGLSFPKLTAVDPKEPIYWDENIAVESQDPIYWDENISASSIEEIGWEIEGALNGLFTISPGKQVYFSKGNLIYNDSEKKYSFASTQYYYPTTWDTDNIMHFGWATAGKKNPDGDYGSYSGHTAYLPTSTSTTDSQYGPSLELLPQGTEINDTWNYSERAAIKPYCEWGMYVGDGEWYTMSTYEWNYLLTGRENAASKRGLGQVNDVHGLIILPDEFTLPEGCSYTGNTTGNWTTNTYTVDQWALMENNGAVFLPTASNRYGTSIIGSGMSGVYWSSSAHNSSAAYTAGFAIGSIGQESYGGRYYGLCVRLVHD